MTMGANSAGSVAVHQGTSRREKQIAQTGFKKGYSFPEGPTYTTIMEFGPQNQNRDGFFGANSIGSVYGPSGKGSFL